jgi:hypothetical protein
MKVNMKKVARIATSLSMTAATAVAIHFLWTKPTFEYLDYRQSKAVELINTYDQAAKGDQQAIRRIEQLTHEGTGYLSYAMLSSIYKKEAIESSGIRLRDPDANLDLVNLEKPDELILQAMREEIDLELLIILRNNRSKFDDAARTQSLEDVATLPPLTANQVKLDAKSTFDQATKDKLLTCYKKLEEKFSHQLNLLLDMRSIGACSRNPPDRTAMSIAKSLATRELIPGAEDQIRKNSN